METIVILTTTKCILLSLEKLNSCHHDHFGHEPIRQKQRFLGGGGAGTDCSPQGSHLYGKNMKKGISIPRNHGTEGEEQGDS